MSKFFIAKPKLIQYCLKNKIGEKRGRGIEVNLIEALFLAEFKGEKIFPEHYKNLDLSSYIIYRDLRLKNFFPVFKELKGEETPTKKYSPIQQDLPDFILEDYYITPDKYVVIDEKHKKEFLFLYNQFWFGQVGVYKKSLGRIFFLDRFEAAYLYKKGILRLREEELNLLIPKNLKDHLKVYSIWRDFGYVLKTGFKFGTDFRIYPPKTTPSKFQHSKHVLHVFPKGFNMRVEELSRAIRVANSVKKTFLLAVPVYKKAYSNPTFFIEGYGVKTFSQEDRISSYSLFKLLTKIESLGLNLLLGIADREGGTSYYEVKKVELENKEFNFFEVKWKNI